MGNREQGPIAVVEGDMAALARGRQALEDLEGLLLRLGCRRVAGVEDLERMGYDLHLVGMGYHAVEKWLRAAREGGWQGG